MAGGGVGDRVVVVGRDCAADADSADDVARVDERHAALAEDELVLAQRRDVVREEHALGEALLEIERGRAKAGGGIGLGARDLRGHPERAVHALADDQMPGLVHHRDRHLEAELLRAFDAALDARARLIARDAAHDTSTRTSPFSTPTPYAATPPPLPANTHRPSRPP